MRFVILFGRRFWPALLGLLWLSLAGFGPAAAAQGQAPARLTIVAPALNVRQGPGVTYPAIAVLNQGDQVPVLSHDPTSDWWQVQLPTGAAGWVSGGPAYVAVGGNTADLSISAGIQTGSLIQNSKLNIQNSSPGGTLVFQTTSGGPIYAINPGCAGLPEGCVASLRYLTVGLDPALSPDGQWVAFTRWENPQNGALGSLWVIKVDGSGERAVLGDVRQPRSPTWSPDGAAIAISVQYGGRIQPENKCSGERPPRDAYDVSTKIEGKADIIYCYTLPPHPMWGLRRVDVATGQFEDLPRDNFSYTPTWNPVNPGQLVYKGERGLIGLDLVGKTTWFLTNDVQDRAPVFSPDGSRLAVTYRQDDHWDIHVLNADGSGATRLTETSYRTWAEQELRGEKPHSWNNAAPAWSPDGRQIAFVTDRTGQWDIWVMNADGSNQRSLFPAGTLAGLTLQYNGMDERMLSWR